MHGPREASNHKTLDVQECLAPGTDEFYFSSTAQSVLEYLKGLLPEVGPGMSEWFRTNNVCDIKSRQYVRNHSLYISKLFPVDIFP